jgi:hypothetical protein
MKTVFIAILHDHIKNQGYSVYSFMNIFGKRGTGIPKELTYLGPPRDQIMNSKFTFKKRQRTCICSTIKQIYRFLF